MLSCHNTKQRPNQAPHTHQTPADPHNPWNSTQLVIDNVHACLPETSIFPPRCPKLQLQTNKEVVANLACTTCLTKHGVRSDALGAEFTRQC